MTSQKREARTDRRIDLLADGIDVVVRVGEGGYTSYVVTNDYAHLLRMAVSGQAITEVPPFMAREPLDDGRLVEILPDYPMPLQTIRALVVDTRALSPLVRQFLDFASSQSLLVQPTMRR